MTVGPVPGEPPMGVGVTSRGVTAAAGDKFCPGLPEPQAASPITTSVTPPPSTASFPLLGPITAHLAQIVFALKLVIVAVPELTRMRRPQEPEVRLVSVAVIIQPAGSVPDDGHTLAVKVEPTTRK
jgi:hypothetical protein